LFDDMTAAERLRGWRDKRGLSQGRAAELVGLSQPAWRAYETGRDIPGADIIAKLIDLTRDDADHCVTFEMFADAARARRTGTEG
jgi:transcriptional regulator with XRE-family HTH domain